MSSQKSSSKVDVGVKILSTGSYLPSRILTNADLSKMVDTSDEWITTRTGIKERRIADKSETASDMGVAASRVAIERAGIKPEELDMIICATISPDKIFPSTACFIQQKLGISEIPAFDVSAACSGFLYAMSVAQGFIKAGTAQKILVVGTEVLSKFTDWQDRSTCVLFGDGAGAMVLAASEDENALLSSYLGADGSYSELLHIPAGGGKLPASEETVKSRMHYMQMAGKEVFKVAVMKMAESFENALAKANLKVSDISLLIPHQANMRIIDAVARRLDFSLDRTYINVHKYGNISAATTIVALDEAINEGRVKKGDIVALVAFGAGFTWGGVIIRI